MVMQRLRHVVTSNRDVLNITVISAAMAFIMGTMQPVLPLYAQSLGASVEQWGLIAMTWGVAMAIGEAFWGWFSDRVDRVAPLLFRAVSGALVSLALLVPTTYWPLFFLNWWRGFTDAAPWPIGRSLVSRTASASHLALAMGLLTTGVRLGSALGAFVGGQVAHAYGYEQALLLSALVSLSTSALVVPTLGWPRWRPSRRASVGLSTPSPRKTLKERTHLAAQVYRPFLILAVITILASAGWFGPLSFLPFVVTSSLGGTVADAGLLFNLAWIATAVFTIPMGRAGDLLSRRTMVIGGLVVIALGLAGVGFADSFAQVAVFLVIGAIGHATLRPSLDALVSDASSTMRRGSIMGLYGACEDVGIIVGPLVGSLTWGIGGATVTFLACGAFAGVGSIVTLVGLRDRRKTATPDASHHPPP